MVNNFLKVQDKYKSKSWFEWLVFLSEISGSWQLV